MFRLPSGMNYNDVGPEHFERRSQPKRFPHPTCGPRVIRYQEMLNRLRVRITNLRKNDFLFNHAFGMTYFEFGEAGIEFDKVSLHRGAIDKIL